VAPDLTSPSGDDAATIPDERILVCPVCQRRFTPAGRRRFCSDACRKEFAATPGRFRVGTAQ